MWGGVGWPDCRQPFQRTLKDLGSVFAGQAWLWCQLGAVLRARMGVLAEATALTTLFREGSMQGRGANCHSATQRYRDLLLFQRELSGFICQHAGVQWVWEVMQAGPFTTAALSNTASTLCQASSVSRHLNKNTQQHNPYCEAAVVNKQVGIGFWERPCCSLLLCCAKYGEAEMGHEGKGDRGKDRGWMIFHQSII